MGFEGVFLGAEGGMGGAEDGVFENTVATVRHFEFGGSRFAEFVGAAGGAFQADAAVFPEFAFAGKAIRGIEISQERQSADSADAGQLFPLFDDRLGAGEFGQLLAGAGDLEGMGVESEPEHLQLPGQGGEFLFGEPGQTFVGISNDSGGDAEAEAAGGGANAADLAGMVLDAAVIEAGPLFQFDAAVIVAVVDGPEETTTQESGELGGVNFVVGVAVGGDQVIAAGIADDELIDVVLEMAVEPAGQGGFLDGEVLFALEAIEDGADGGNGGGQAVTGFDTAVGLNGNFGVVAMQVGSDIIGFHDGSFRIGFGFCVGPLYPRMPSFHIFTNEHE